MPITHTGIQKLRKTRPDGSPFKTDAKTRRESRDRMRKWRSNPKNRFKAVKRQRKLRLNPAYRKIEREKDRIAASYRWHNLTPSEKTKKLKYMQEYNKKIHTKRKILVMTHYSKGAPKCSCCGETILDFLTIDHINQNGTQHRKKHKITGHIYKWLIDKHLPKGFDVLCFNCNLSRSFPYNNGICPHKKVIQCQ